VFRAVHLPTGKEVALKVMKLDALTDVKELKAEIMLLSKIRCSNVVKYFGSYIKNKTLWVRFPFYSNLLTYFIRSGLCTFKF
jgi:serine/threonine protein kinase